jgi:signal transduction histidine kinase
MMRADVERLRAFIDHVLIAGRLEHQDLPPALVVTELGPLVARCVDDVCRRHGVPALAVRVELEVERVRTDPVALDVIVSNLLDNAVKYGGPEPRVVVRCAAVGGWLAIEVQDRGVGLARADLGKVFRRFFRVEREGQPRVRGTGLGLYVADQLARKLGGTIRATSEGPGRGATFRLELPLLEVMA